MQFYLSTRSRVLGIVSGILVLFLSSVAECGAEKTLKSFDYTAINCRKHSVLLTDFGGIGDGKTLNTKAFKAAIDHLRLLARDGGGQLIVPPGKWLTGSFNLTSHFTLYIHKDAVILGSQEESDYPLIPPLPSYGKGRDGAGRFASLILGVNLVDVVITGGNGTINGQGKVWWDKFKQKKLVDTRPYLIEMLFCDRIQISNLTLIDSPSWNIHPVYCRTVIIQGMTILAPVTVPNTDGIDPDSCANVKIEDCYIVSGDDCIAVKSGWDQYGINYGVPTIGLIIRRLTCISPDSAAIAFGSEMSGGIRNIRAEEIVAINTQSGIRIKTGVGRGGHVRDIYVRNMTMKTMMYVFWMTGNYGSHPDDAWDRNALPIIDNINFRDVVAENVTYSARLDGISGSKFTGICISDVKIGLTENPKKLQWNCTNVKGVTSNVKPQSCDLLPPSKAPIRCTYPDYPAPVENAKLQICSYSGSASTTM